MQPNRRRTQVRPVGFSPFTIGGSWVIWAPMLLLVAAFFLSSQRTTLVPIATVETKADSAYVEWAVEPTIGEDGIIKMTLNNLQPDPLKRIYFRLSWERSGVEACADDGVPLSGRPIICQFDPKANGVPAGATIAIDLVVVDFSGNIVQMLPTESVQMPGRSWQLIAGGVALLSGFAIFVVGLIRRRSKR